MAQMSEKDYLKSVLDIGIAIASLADAYRKLHSDHNISFGEACGMVIGMALGIYSDHDNSDEDQLTLLGDVKEAANEERH